ncbi:hypothetical protein [Desulfococcus multivorans]|uniref:hypothetical protein n=1 Tax=Desulfococcus multivorans TaxID=897 RepID=UPI0003FBA316|nr:hypothetical protein [Desulfococcus multivorans]AOY57460.1 uncharacterized protein Dmul_06850 [Desulfococcus multivorans]MDY0038866.1 hypothetical protein [Desulforhabdus sp.]
MTTFLPQGATLIKAIQDIMRKDVGVDGDAQRISQPPGVGSASQPGAELAVVF